VEVPTGIACGVPGFRDRDARVRHGFIGVQLFFMISGFILAVPFAQSALLDAPSQDWKSYYVRRLTRIEPPYIINLTLLFAYLVFLRQRSASDLWTSWLASCIYCHNLFNGTGSRINGVTWSLEVEVQFYILAPFLALVFRIPSVVLRRATVLSAMTIAGLLFSKEAGKNHGYHLLTEINFFLTGFLLADVYLTEWRTARVQRRLLWDVFGLASAVLLLLVAHFRGADPLLIPPLLYVFGTAAFQGRLLNNLLTQSAVFTIGGMCYTIYLYHYRILALADWAVTRYVPMPDSGLAQAGIAVLILTSSVIAGCAILFLVFEKPFMQRHWPTRLWAAMLKWRRQKSNSSPGDSGMIDGNVAETRAA
jgi:peptidoglycan/LPS O-acetylase OafA/YrhL